MVDIRNKYFLFVIMSVLKKKKLYTLQGWYQWVKFLLDLGRQFGCKFRIIIYFKEFFQLVCCDYSK